MLTLFNTIWKRSRPLPLLGLTALLAVPARAQNVQYLPNVTVIAGIAAGATQTAYTGEGGPATAATFPGLLVAATSDPQGNIYFTDVTGNAVRRVDAVTGVITTFAGGITATGVCAGANGDQNASGAAIGDGCPATQAFLNAPNGVRFYKGNLYIADTTNNYIRVVNVATGIIDKFAGTGAKTATALKTPAVTATLSSFPAPTDIIFDPAGNAYVTVGGGFAYVLRIAAGAGTVTAVAGNGTAASSGDGGPATAAALQTPNGLALDPTTNNLYVSGGTPNNVRVINLTTGIINTYVGNAQNTSTSGFTGDGGPANQASLKTPQHIAVDALGNLYIADQGNAHIRMVTSPANGSIISSLAGTATAGVPTTSNSPSGTVSVNANLNATRGVDVLASGDILVADSFNRQIKMIAPPTSFPATAVGSTVNANATVRINTATTPAAYGVPTAYKAFTSGPVIGAVSTTCTLGTQANVGSLCQVPVTFQPVSAGTQRAPLIFTDSAGNNYLLPLQGLGNAPAAAVLPGVVSALAGTGASGNAGDNGPATAALLNAPTAVATDGLGNYYFTSSGNNEVRMVSASTGVITRVAGTGLAGNTGDGGAATGATLNAPSGLAVDGAGNLYIADTGNNRIRVVSNGLISAFAGTGTAGAGGDGGPAAAAGLSAPKGLYLTPAGVLYVADTGNHVVRTIGVRSTAINTIAGTIGVKGFSGDTGQSTSAQLNTPAGVVVDNNGNIYIADTGNNSIRRVTSNGMINTYAGATAAGFADGTAGANGAALFNGPTALAVDAGGTLYVADTNNSAIRRVANGAVLTVAGTGNPGFTGNGGSSAVATFNTPQGLALDLSGNVIISDTGNNALRSIAVAASRIAFPTTSPNTTSAPIAVSLTNSGNQPLTIASVTVPANFAEQASGSGNVDCNSANLTLAAGASCQASFVFSPTAVQTYSGNVVITDNAQTAAAATQTISITGTGVYVYTAAISSPASVTAGQSFTSTVTVTNPNAQYLGTIRFSSSDPKAVFPNPTYTFTAADNGRHTFTGLQLGTAGIQTVTVTDTVTPTITASSIITVVGGPAATLSVVSGSGQTVDISTSSRTYRLPLIVQAVDALGNASSGVSITFTAPSTGADASFGVAAGPAIYTGMTNSRGQVTSPQLFADAVTGAFNVTATATGASSAVFSLTNTSIVPAGFTLGSNPSSITSLPAGTSGSTTVTITPQGGFNAPVTVACAGAIPTTTCTLSPTTVAPSGNGNSTTFTVTLQTTGPSASLRRVGTPVYACLLLFSFGCVVRSRKKLRGLSLVVFCGVALPGLNGCGNGVNSNQTPAGTYALTITGTSGSITATPLTITYYIAGTPQN